MFKQVIGVLVVGLLTACATGEGAGERDVEDLIRPQYLRSDTLLMATFPEIQMALFTHERVCGDAPHFQVKEGEASYATIVEDRENGRAWRDKVIFDLAWLEPSMRQETRTKVEVYSFKYNRDIKQRIKNMFAAIENPEACPEEKTS